MWQINKSWTWVFLGMTQQALHTWIGGFSAILLCKFSSSVRLDGDHRWTAIFRSLQRCSIGFKSGLWLYIHRVVPKPLLCCLGCVLKIIVLLEGEPLAQSVVLSTVKQVFIEDISVLCSIQLSLNPDQSPSSCRWKTPPQKHPHRLLPAHYTFGMVLCRWWAELVSFKHGA